MQFSENLFGFDRPETDGQRLFVRIFEAFVLYGTIYLAWKWGAYILLISDVVLPLGLARFFDISFMFENALPLWNAGAITLFALASFFRVPYVRRAGYAVALFLLLVQYAARYSLGEIPHSGNTVGMALLAFSIASVAFGFTSEARRFAMGFTYFFLGLGYTLAAWCKLIATGPTWVDGRHLWMWINEKSIDAMAKSGVLEFNALQELLLDSHFLATAVLTFGLVTEFFAFLMWWRRFRMPVMLAVLVLHIGIYFTMNILFRLSMYELVLLGLPWSAWIDRLLATPVGATLGTRLRPTRQSFAT